MQLIGLTGGIACGKSTAVQYLKFHGLPVVDADQISHDLMRPGTTAYRVVCRLFPEAIDTETGILDREKLGSIVFASRQQRKRLERILHPLIISNIFKEIAWYWMWGYSRVIVDIPLLFETGLDKIMSFIVVIHSDEPTQIQRLISRNGISQAQALQRIKAQMSAGEKANRADIVIDNSGTIAELHRRLEASIINKPVSFIYHNILLHLLPLFLAAMSISYFLIRYIK